MCMMYIIHTAVWKDWFARKGKVVPGTCSTSDVEGLPSWSLTKSFFLFSYLT